MFTVSRFDAISSTAEAETAKIIQLLDLAYGFPVSPARLNRFLACEPHGWTNVHHENGALVGVGGTIAYPDGGFGWIGLVATDPAFERQGIGRMVTEACVAHLRSRHCSPVLDASADGAPLYRRMGFVDSGQSALFSHDGATFPDVPNSVVSPAVTATQFEQLLAYDLPRFGADRSRLLAYLRDEFPGRIFLSFARDHEQTAGELDGFAVAQDNIIGPLVADNAAVASALLAASLSATFAARPRLPLDADSSYRAQVEAAGFTFVRSLARQQLGIVTLPGRRHLLCAQTSLGEG